MPRDGVIIFRDTVGKLDVLRVECDKCGQRGSYRIDRLIERYGIGEKVFDFEPEADCPRKIARNPYDAFARQFRHRPPSPQLTTCAKNT